MTSNGQGDRNPHHPVLTKHPDGTVTITCACGRNFYGDTLKEAADLWERHL